jgi:hypothetical protein
MPSDYSKGLPVFFRELSVSGLSETDLSYHLFFQIQGAMEE